METVATAPGIIVHVGHAAVLFHNMVQNKVEVTELLPSFGEFVGTVWAEFDAEWQNLLCMHILVSHPSANAGVYHPAAAAAVAAAFAAAAAALAAVEDVEPATDSEDTE